MGDDDVQRPAWGPLPSSSPPTSSPSGRRRLSVVASVALGLLLAVVAVTSLALIFSKDADKDAQHVFVHIGNCYHDRGGEGVLLTEAYQPCSSPHDREVVGVVPFAGTEAAPYPGRDHLAQTTDEACPTKFRDYVGASYPAAGLVLDILLPTSSEWVAGFRDGVCGVADAGGAPLTTTVRHRATSKD